MGVTHTALTLGPLPYEKDVVIGESKEEQEANLINWLKQ